MVPTPNNSNSMYPFFSKTNNAFNIINSDINSYYNKVNDNSLSQSDMKYKNIMDTLVELEHKVQETQKALKSKINSVNYSNCFCSCY